ncbi:MAG: cation:proton antiporter [Rhodospirillales bacterium]
MEQQPDKGMLGTTAEDAVEAVEGAVKGAAEAVEGAVKAVEGAVSEAVGTAAEVAVQTAAHSNLTGIAAVVLAALVCGMMMERFRQPALVGYIVAGVLLGPSALAVVEDRAQIDVLAELGVLLLLFVIGMELSLRSFRRIWGLTLLVTGFQITASVGVMLLLSLAFGWPLGLAVLLGFVVALSSTAVAIKILENIGELRTRSGRIAVGVLIAQDLAVVPMMLGIDAMGGSGGFDWLVVPKILVSVALLAWLILFLSRREKVNLPFGAAVAEHPDLKPLAAMAFCFGCAALSGLVGLSAAYGAFIAGLILGNSAQRRPMLEATHPIQSVLMMAFFLSIGLLIDLDYIWGHLGTVLLLFFLVSVFKTALNVVFLGLIGQPWRHAFLSGIVLSQIGEFSFLLSVVGFEAGVIGEDDQHLVIAVTVLSLSLSPLWVITGRRLRTLAQEGITSGSELMRLVYGPETEFVTEALDKASSKTQRALRMLALWLRRQRQRRQRRRAADEPPPAAAQEAAQGAAQETAQGAAQAAEIIPPRKPTGEPPAGGTAAAAEAEGKPKTKKRRRRKRKRTPDA